MSQWSFDLTVIYKILQLNLQHATQMDIPIQRNQKYQPTNSDNIIQIPPFHSLPILIITKMLGFPVVNKPTYTVDTSAKKDQFLHNVRLSEKHWAEDNFEQSLNKLGIAISIGKYVVLNESQGPVRDFFGEKMKELIVRQQERTQQLKQGKPVQYIKQKGQGSGGSGGGHGNHPKKQNDDDSNKREGAISEAIVTEKPNVKWQDISGLENAKSALKEAVILPIKYPQMFTGARKPWKGILLYGPPGTGKTYLAKACATQADGTFFSVSSSDLMSKYVGESEKLIKQLFNLARQKKPSIIFIDEIDSMCGSRSDNENQASRRVKTEFLVQMQGVGKDDQGILVLGATNLPWALDPAIRRRFQRRIYISLPEVQARYGMLKKGLKDNANNITDQQLKQFAYRTEGYSGSDLANLVKDAVYEPVRKLQSATKFRKVAGSFMPVENTATGPDVVQTTLANIPGDQLQIPPITAQDIESALKKTKASVDNKQLKEYEQFTASFGQDG